MERSSVCFSLMMVVLIILEGAFCERKALLSASSDIGRLIGDLWPSSNDGGGGACMSRIRAFDYPCEEHNVTTKDGYILSMERIPGGRSRPSSNASKAPVVLQHGILMDGMAWLLNSPEESLAYILADSGFDVWIPNSRGTVYSLAHTTLLPDNPAYWDWSWDELAAYDLPATIGYIYSKTGQRKIHYIGHSLGTLTVLSSLSNPSVASMLRSATLLSPIAYLNHISSTLVRTAADMYLGEGLYKTGFSQFDPNGMKIQVLIKEACSHVDENCYDLLKSITGKNCCLNSSSLKVFLDHEPQSTSTKNLVHLSQMVRRGTVAKYDYDGGLENFAKYGQATAPSYKISIPKGFPLLVSYGKEDSLSDVEDVRHLLELINSGEVHFMEDYAHMDFIMAYNANSLLYQPIIKFLNLN